ncbi:hypothetical protein DPMN_097430 [Dreissena polymorpha]|uniref:Uncharacterized protein n=1 Tax=Dreissena polymorpha TaxID=45954 RepID=A0A9D4LA89_DREPO|nr:hypothetical protein DPMN_097430 [Dreissena polymorpha]
MTYNCSFLRKAAIRKTEITTGSPQYNKQPIYGTRATDFTLDLKLEDIDLASFFGEKASVRITSAASPQMIISRLSELFRNNTEFTLEIVSKIKEMILEDLRGGR